MLNCDEAELTRVNNVLRENGLQPVRSGFAYRAASDGRLYRRYVRLESTPGDERLGQLLNDTLGANRRDIAASRYIDEFDAENHRLRNEIGVLRSENVDLKARILALEQAQNPARRDPDSSRRRELDAVIDAVLPGIFLVRDSISIIERELESCEFVLSDLRTLRWEPPALPAGAKPVHSAPPWWGSRFRTGQKDDGRLYFRKREDGGWNVLVSFKQCQDRDFEYLKKN